MVGRKAEGKEADLRLGWIASAKFRRVSNASQTFHLGPSSIWMEVEPESQVVERCILSDPCCRRLLIHC